MSTFGRSLKIPGYLSMGRQSGMSGRALSNSSEVSLVLSSAPGSPVDAARSGRSTPVSPAGETMGHDKVDGRGGRTRTSGGGASAGDRDRQFKIEDTLSAKTNILPVVRSPSLQPSRPIAIELPSTSKVKPVASDHTPPAPLSGRGDLPGGYFPLHEEKARVHRPHPFHTDVTRARHHSISLAGESASPVVCIKAARPAAVTAPPSAISGMPKPQTQPATTTAAAAPVALMGPMSADVAGLPSPLLSASQPKHGATHTPVASYMPSGLHDVPLPMGKYYPSNYERHQERRPAASVARSVAKSDSHVATYGGENTSPKQRSESEAKRRLQQYQRDMIAQASLAAGRVLAKTSDDSAAARMLQSNGLSIKSLQYTAHLASKPISPRLVPLGSPGPVTPMDLESGDATPSYMDRMVSPSSDISRVVATAD